jgi:hypothetical protein
MTHENLQHNQRPRGLPNGGAPCGRTDYDSYKPARLQESKPSVTEFAVKHVYGIVYNVASGRQSMTQGLWHDAAATCVISAGVGGQSDVVIQWVAACMGEWGIAYRIFVGQSLSPANFDSRTVQQVASHYTDKRYPGSQSLVTKTK